MKFEELQKSKSYQKILTNIGILGAFFVFVFALFMFSIGTTEAGPIVISILLSLGMIAYMGYYVQDVMKIKRLAKTFEKCTGRAVNIAGVGRGTIKFVIVFEDDMGEEHRMPSHGFFSSHEAPSYMEKDIEIYFSKEYPKVLIAKDPDEELANEKDQQDDPYAL
jgi:hypothetical protein